MDGGSNAKRCRVDLAGPSSAKTWFGTPGTGVTVRSGPVTRVLSARDNTIFAVGRALRPPQGHDGRRSRDPAGRQPRPNTRGRSGAPRRTAWGRAANIQRASPARLVRPSCPAGPDAKPFGPNSCNHGRHERRSRRSCRRCSGPGPRSSRVPSSRCRRRGDSRRHRDPRYRRIYGLLHG